MSGVFYQLALAVATVLSNPALIAAAELPECKLTPNGALYQGTLNVTVGGIPCQRWDMTTPHEHSNDPANFPDGSLSAAENYCRNPDGESDIWCYTTDPDVRWELCKAPPMCANALDHCEVHGGTCVQTSCCPNNMYVFGGCSDIENSECCLATPDCAWKEVRWPEGSYALARSVHDCPDHPDVHWFTGSVVTNWDAALGPSQWTPGLHHLGQYGDNTFTWQTCSKMDAIMADDVISAQPPWPNGSYCVYKMAVDCPPGLTEGQLNYHANAAQLTRVSGRVPMTKQGDDFSIHFCCKTGGNVTSNIQLPTGGPFLLLKHGEHCQAVANMDLMEEQFSMAMSNSSSITVNGSTPVTVLQSEDGTEVILGLCYYQVPDTCYHEEDFGHSYHGPVNFILTHQGTHCGRWDANSWFALDMHPSLHYVQKSNYCTNLRSLMDQPFCPTALGWTTCGIPECEFDPSDYRLVREDLPVTRTDGDAIAARLAFLSSGACSFELGPLKPWWQINLMQVETVVAISGRNNMPSDCYFRQAQITVGMASDDFLLDKALSCRHNVSTGVANYVMLTCTQPVSGQFLTFRNLKFLETDWMRSLIWIGCLNLCGLKIYVRKIPPNEGHPFSTSDVIGEAQMSSSSTQDGLNPASATLHSSASWCADLADQNPYLQVDLLVGRRVSGLVSQGEAGEKAVAQVTAFVLHYGMKEENLHPYTTMGEPEVFQRVSLPTEEERHIFSRNIYTRLMRFVITDFHLRPCLRVEILGDTHSPANLALNHEATLSSTLGSMVTYTTLEATDGSLATCVRTAIEVDPWIIITLPQKYVIEAVVMKLDFSSFVTGPKMCWLQDDFGVSYAGPVNTTRDGQECQLWEIAKDLDHENGARLPEGSHALADNYCRNPSLDVTGPFCYPLHRTDTVICSAIHCADYDYVMRIDVSDSSSGMDAVWKHCFQGTKQGVSPTLAVDCEQRPAAADTLRIQQSGIAFIYVCELEVYGTVAEPPVQFDLGQARTRMSCPSGQNLIWTDVGDQELDATGLTTITADTAVRAYMEEVCFGQSSSCIVPSSWPHLSNDVNSAESVVGVGCRPASPPELDDGCEIKVTSPGPLLSMSDYLRMYDTMKTCTWHIQALPDQFIKVNISAIGLASPEHRYNDLSYDPGICEDSLYVVYHHTNGEGISMRVNAPSVFISPSSTMDVHLYTCFRFDPMIPQGLQMGIDFSDTEFQQELELESEYERSACQGCAVQQQCSGVNSCPGPCGYFLSPGFPVRYQANEKCSWSLEVAPNSYIKLVFEHFDVFEEDNRMCAKDHVALYNVRRHDDGEDDTDLVELYCNTNKPPNVIYSNWNKMVVDFSTDFSNERSGFMAKYESIQYESDDFDTGTGDSIDDCPVGWAHYQDNCYLLVDGNTTLTWTAAEKLCLKMGGHLLSMQSETEMLFVHSLLLESNITTQGIYIGLNDRQKEGSWMWTDGSPMAYSHWYISESSKQPDGVTLEDCTYMKLSSIRPTGNWHDVPCAFDEISHYFCKYQLRVEGGDGQSLEVNMPSASCGPDVFQCTSGDCIHWVHVCDGHTDCVDGSDEHCAGDQEGPEDECMSDQFRCNSGQCISVSFYCDFQPDCEDGSDEQNCARRECTSEDFKCSSGECIQAERYCDLWLDCKDESDERDCDTCSRSTAFQCYDGSCISKTLQCDGMVDCPGDYKEDEGVECTQQSFHSCLEYFQQGYTENGKYLISPGGFGSSAVEVSCDFTSSEGHVTTIIHHNSEERILNAGFEADASYVRNVLYFIPIEQIKEIKTRSLYCEQFIRIECTSSGAYTGAYWLNIDLQKESYHYDEAVGDPACTCRFRTGACDVTGWTTCVCSADTKYTGVDYGYFVEKDKLPVRGLTLSDTGSLGEYSYHELGPLLCYQGYYNLSNAKMRCDDGNSIDVGERCLYGRDSYGTLQGCRDGSHLQQCENATCPSGYAKCPESYCVTAAMLCDGQLDCPHGEDENQCEPFKCATGGMYRCWQQTRCIPDEQRCDGQRQCLHGDDEWFCDVKCPPSCTCKGLYFSCQQAEIATFPSISIHARSIDISINNIRLTQYMFNGFKELGQLRVSENGIAELYPDMFSSLASLFHLDISANHIQMLVANVFRGLVSLAVLNLSGNPLIHIEPGAFASLAKMEFLELKNMNLETIPAGAFQGLDSVSDLDLSASKIVDVQAGAFSGLPSLSRLNISLNNIIGFEKEEFRALVLSFLHSDDYKFCCFVDLGGDQCFPAKDQFSSCEDLMGNDTLRVFLWLLGLTALLGNLFVFIWRTVQYEHMVSSYMVKYLALADFLMGIYMIGIAAVDVHYRGRYIENASDWKKSWLCKLLGFISTTSSEASVFTLFAVTMDRLINIVAPFSAVKLDIKKARIVIALVWVFASLIGAIPLLPSGYFEGEFYSRSGVCVSLHITTEETPGWQYSVAVFHGLNFSIFVCIFVAYSYMYNVIRGTMKASGTGQRGKEMAAARKMTVIVLTDFLCWVPINIMGVLAMTGTEIPGEIYAWTVVFILPVNSALNPVLYTISSISLPKKKKSLGSQNTTRKSMISKTSTVQISAVQRAECVALTRLLNDPMMSRPTVILQLARDVTRTLASMHDVHLLFPQLDASYVMVSSLSKETLEVSLLGAPVAMRDDVNEMCEADDMSKMGKLVSRLLTAHAMVVKKGRTI